MADAADQLPGVGAGLPANETVAECGLLCGDGQRFAFGAARTQERQDQPGALILE